MLDDPALEARARALSAELRCMVCQNQSIDDSDAPLAHDLRVLLRERLVAGDTDAEVIDFLVARYGEFILLKPRFNVHTALLWLTPAILLIGGGVVAFGVFRRRRLEPAAASGLSDEEEAELRQILSDEASWLSRPGRRLVARHIDAIMAGLRRRTTRHRAGFGNLVLAGASEFEKADAGRRGFYCRNRRQNPRTLPKFNPPDSGP